MLCPLQIADGVAVGVTVGFAFTVTEIVPVAKQVFASVTVTVKVVLDVGETLPLETFPAKPLLHTYVKIAPLPAVAFAASVVLCPLQMVDGVAVGATVGTAFTVTETLAVAVQVLLFVTVTV